MERWIRVEDELPEASTAIDTKWVWCFFRHKIPGAKWEQGLCRWLEICEKWTSQQSNNECEVSHWMRLPENPVVSSEEIPVVIKKSTTTKLKFTPHDGGPCPVDGDVVVFIKVRCGDTFALQAELLDWNHMGGPRDIIAYCQIEIEE